jgi:hypothetical protein
VAQEVSRLLQVISAGWRKTGRVDLEAVEMAMRGAMHRAGASALRWLLSQPSKEAPTVTCSCGQQARYHDTRPKQLLTVVGPVQIERGYYVCPSCHQGQSPRDAELDVLGTECSPGVRRMMAVVGSESSFDQGRQQLDLLAGLEVTAKAVERHAEAIGADVAQHEQSAIQRAVQLPLPEVLVPDVPIMYAEMDATGVPVVRAETEGRTGQVTGQPARTRQVKLGCVFTQTKSDDEGRPIRDPDSTTYTGAIEDAAEFGWRLFTEAWRRGWNRARIKVVLGDGAVWIWNLADLHFPGALQIVDLYHARQHLWDLAERLFPADEKRRKRWAHKQIRKLDAGRIEALVAELRNFPVAQPELQHTLETEADYFQRNAERMRYPQFRAQGLFVGSGVIEAGCKTLIGSRLKQSGMFWTVRGANAIIALRCARLSGKFEDYWESRSRAA